MKLLPAGMMLMYVKCECPHAVVQFEEGYFGTVIEKLRVAQSSTWNRLLAAQRKADTLEPGKTYVGSFKRLLPSRLCFLKGHGSINSRV
jgi:hypothetical protein